MLKNATIMNTSLKDLLGVLDARAGIYVFEQTEEGEKDISGVTRNVYEYLADRDFLDEYGRYTVIGINMPLSGIVVCIKKPALEW